MEPTLHVTTTVLPGHRIEISAPELPEGGTVEVIVIVPPAPPPRRTILDFLNALPPGPRSAPTWEEIEHQFQAERDAWER